MKTHMPASSLKPLKIGMLLYPGFTLLDLAGPQSALGMHSETRLFWKTMEAVPTDSGISLNPTHTFADVLQDLDVLFVPGGFGTNEAMKDEAIIDFLMTAGRRARYITSVCSGSLLLGMAGLLDGYRAATHWALYDVLEALGIDAGRERVVADRNRLTGGGVTAGIDFGLTLLAELRGEHVAKLTQLMMEYDPQPPFDTGHPRTAGLELTELAQNLMGYDAIREGVQLAQERRVPSPA